MLPIKSLRISGVPDPNTSVSALVMVCRFPSALGLAMPLYAREGVIPPISSCMPPRETGRTMKGRLVIASIAALLSLAHRTAVAGKVAYIYTDIQGTPVMESDAQGHITARYDYAPYGAAVQGLSGSPNGPGYTGHVNDPDTGFVYMQARYYDPAMGRFLSIDPVSPVPSNSFNFNRYSYGNLAPVTYMDPGGRVVVFSNGGAKELVQVTRESSPIVDRELGFGAV